MSDNNSTAYLNAHSGICVGGMFFKVKDWVHLEGQMYFSTDRMVLDGIIDGINTDRKMLFVMAEDNSIYVFNYTKLTRMEHAQKTRAEWLQLIKEENA